MIAAGQSIGNYRILAKIGTGGMGAVYLAEHPLIGKRVALKVIHRELASNRDVVSRFFQEARAANKIGNEHIVQIHDFGVTPNGDHFFIMEYLQGKTLASVLAREPALDVMRALHIGAQIAAALAAAHANGIIHRDLKPDNVMLLARPGEPDFVKVLDFGLAKVFSAANTVRTAAGVLLGTPQYMSPEACESKGDVDHRTDIYALGILLFQMMTGSLPFTGESMGEVLVKQVTVLPPAPRACNPRIPPSVEQILLRCLAKPADARFSTMMELRDALLDPEAYLHGSPPIAPARSVGPGERLVDAKTVMAHAGSAHQQTRLAAPGAIQRAISQSSPAAPTVLAGQQPATGPYAAPQEPKMNTMRIATPPGYSSRPPHKLWPFATAALLLGLVGGVVSVLWAGTDEPTALASEQSAPSAPSASEPQGVPVAELDVVAEPAPFVPESPRIGPLPEITPSLPPPPSPVRPVIPADVAKASLSIDSVPSGAEVSGPTGDLLGQTPLKIDWPLSDLPVAFTVRLDGYKRKVKQTVVNGNTALRIELERVSSKGRAGKAAKAGKLSKGAKATKNKANKSSARERTKSSSGAVNSNGLMPPD